MNKNNLSDDVLKKKTSVNHFLLIMRTTIILLFTCFFITFAETSYSQNAKVSINKQNVNLKEVLNEIEHQTDYLFIYNNEVNTNATVSVKSNNKSVKEVLTFVLKDTDIDFSMEGNHIILSCNEEKVRGKNKDVVEAGQQQRKTIKGTVRDVNGETIPFVHVVIKGSTSGTATDINGKFEIFINEDVTLIFSLMGFKDYEVNTAGKKVIDVILIEESQTLEEVVVTGYNLIERQHLASSIETMDVSKMKSRPIFKLQEGFSGTIPGATLLQGSNLPGSTHGTIQIRGVSSLQGAEPLVIVDGMEQSLHDIDPNQIKSIHVLKDAASASMYGSRGANGVIIIETERGMTSEFSVNVHAWTALHKPIDLPTFVSSADYMRLNNEARSYQGQELLYTQEDIEKSEQGILPNTNWLKEVMQRQSHSYNISANIAGGGGVGTFNLMTGYIKEMGLNDYEGTQKFSARFNTNINIADKFVLLADFYAHRLQVDRLYANDDGHGLYQIAWRMNPTQEPLYNDTIPDSYRLYNSMNPVASIEKGGSKNFLHDRSTINLRPKYYVNEDLHIEGNISYMINKSANKHVRRTFKFYDSEGKPSDVWSNDVGAEQGVSVSQITARGLLNYNKSLRQEKDKLYAIIGAEMMNYNYTDYREEAKLSYFTKWNYSFDNRYLLEATIRYDGNSKFAPGHQWGFFPSGSIGWNIHNENFMSKLRKNKTVNTMKLRLSYGKIGNENVMPYLWQEIVNTWGWTMRVPNPDFTWEKQKQLNIGADLVLLNNRLGVTVDVYNKYSYDLIYSNFPVPPLTGSYYLTSSVNIGEVRNKGWEVSASWSDKIGDLSYTIKGMLFDNRNEVLKAGYSSSDTLIFKDNKDKIWYKGIPIENYYGYESDGYWQNQAEIDEATAIMPNTIPGDIKYVDQNGDGIINDDDKVFLGDPFPHYNYSLNVDLKYKQWDFSILGQGVGKRTGRLNGQEGFPVLVDGSANNLGAPRQEYMDNRWTPETPNSRFPRVWTGSTPNSVLSDVWLSDASYFRIKTIQLGYNIPKLGKHFRNARFYINAQDALTFTNWEGLEPERNGGNGSYPRMASFSIGVNVTIF